MNYILLDPHPLKFYPFTLTRPLAEMRIFGGTIKEIWEKKLGVEVSYLTRPELSDLYTTRWSDENIIIKSDFNPLCLDHYFSIDFSDKSLKIPGCTIRSAEKIGWPEALGLMEEVTVNNLDICKKEDIEGEFFYNLVDLLSINFNIDFLIKNQSDVTRIDCSKNNFLNDEDGPILVEKGVVIMEGAMIRGPVHICEGSIVKMGAKIYGPTLIGPYCKIGGEVSNSIFLGYSNKAHDGFLGHSIIGEWCNIGAGTSNSNLKNNYDVVKMWDYESRKFQDSGKQFLGLYMGDHSKCAINTSFNTGTTVGVNCNIFGSGFPRNYIPSFSWWGNSGYKDYDIDKAVKTAKIVMKRRGVKMSPEYEKMLRMAFNMTASFRS